MNKNHLLTAFDNLPQDMEYRCLIVYFMIKSIELTKRDVLKLVITISK